MLKEIVCLYQVIIFDIIVIGISNLNFIKKGAFNAMKSKLSSIPNYWYTVIIAVIILVMTGIGVSAYVKSTDSFNTDVQHTVIDQTFTINDNARLYGRGSDSLYNILNLKQGGKYRSSTPIALNVKRADNTYQDIVFAPNALKIRQTSQRFATINIHISQDVVTTTHYLHKWNIFNRDSTSTTKVANVHKTFTIHAPAELMVHFPLG